jgi:6-phosphogluconolactonase
MPADVRRFADLDAVSAAAADELAALARRAVDDKGSFTIALSGGSTPRRLFELLARRGREALPWDQIELYWGDERTVPPDHADSNFRMAREALIDPLKLDPSRVHRMRGEDPDHAAAAATYAAELQPLGEPFPVFDYVMLGLGSDGHTASLFPDTPALDETQRVCVANPVDSLTRGKTVRLTLTARAINWARVIRFLVVGADKAQAVREVIEGGRDPRRLPAQLIRPIDGSLAWLVDEAAAARLGGAA